MALEPNTNHNPDPLVSVLMCAFNVEPYIERAVYSILKQTYTNFELLISDDGSTDGTRKWLKSIEEHPKVKIFYQEKNLGYVANKNFLFKKAKGEFITQNDSDDVSDVNRLAKQVAAFQDNSSFKIIACGYKNISFTDVVYNVVQPQDNTIIYSNSETPYPFWFPALLIHRSVIDEVGLFSDYFSGMGDDLYWTVKANEKFPIYCIKDALYYYRANPNSITHVLDKERKLIVNELLNRILKQRRDTKTDFLEENDYDALVKLEADIWSDKHFVGEQYRIWASKAINAKDMGQAKNLLIKSFKNRPMSLDLVRTILYYIKASKGK